MTPVFPVRSPCRNWRNERLLTLHHHHASYWKHSTAMPSAERLFTFLPRVTMFSNDSWFLHVVAENENVPPCFHLLAAPSVHLCTASWGFFTSFRHLFTLFTCYESTLFTGFSPDSASEFYKLDSLIFGWKQLNIYSFFLINLHRQRHYPGVILNRSRSDDRHSKLQNLAMLSRCDWLFLSCRSWTTRPKVKAKAPPLLLGCLPAFISLS